MATKGTVKEVSEAELRRHLKADDRRTAPRVDARMDVEVPLASWDQFRRVYTANISHGGLMFLMSSPASIPATMTLAVTLPDGKVVRFDSEVRHVARRGESTEYEVGVQFTALDDSARRTLDAALAEIAKA